MNKLIVESDNDKIFIEKLKSILNIDNLEISQPLCSIDEFICLDGLGNLEKKLKDIKLDDNAELDFPISKYREVFNEHLNSNKDDLGRTN